ncbi:MAG: hypothetical protein JXB06_11410 [Spirochaetales bacterium]|nr:hypothetical protein [Spirochaetales bacterium]
MGRSARIAVVSLVFLLLTVLTVQGIGVSFCYLLPRNGTFSHPVYPLSFRGIGMDIGRYFGASGSLSLYSIRGMGIKDSSGSPIETGGPLVGPFLSILGSAVFEARVPIPPLELEASGGLFGCYNIDPPLVTGNLDRYLAGAAATPYETVTSSLSCAGRWGWGWVFGGKATFFIKGQLGVFAGANYYVGGSKLELSGSYAAAVAGQPPVTVTDLPAELQDASLDFSGLEIILGAEIRL